MFYVYWLYHWDDDDIYKSGYVGITDDLIDRFRKHRKRFDNFKYKIVFTGSQAQAFALEHHLRPKANMGWNKAIGGLQFGVYSPMMGRKHSLETIEKIRASNLGLKHNIINPRINFKHSEETKAKLAETSRARKHRPESKAKVSEALRKRVRKPETYAKLALANTGKKASLETRRKMSEGKRGKLIVDPSKIIILNKIDAEPPTQQG